MGTFAVFLKRNQLWLQDERKATLPNGCFLEHTLCVVDLFSLDSSENFMNLAFDITQMTQTNQTLISYQIKTAANIY